MSRVSTLRGVGVAVVVTLLSAGAIAASTPACSLVDPEVGDRLLACSDVPVETRPIDFKTEIRPLLDGARPPTKGCKNCHYPGVGTQEGFLETGFDAHAFKTLRNGGRFSGTNILVPGKPCSSIIVQKLRGSAPGPRMPKDGPFWGPKEIQLVMDWIAQGATAGDED